MANELNEISLIPNVIDTIIKAGPTTIIFAWLWWLERKERLKLFELILKMSESVTDMNQVWSKILPKPRRGAD